ncbi:hypothetical protein DL239_13485 [Sedimentitalea sp. CY04]|uniref:Uncharacterized protein n=1 Tax=Parasedimentitalea denitrificans TaxID=2211118 RepID=A0ABX0W8K3_9RHOB|nr:hypothetical protein [Sedimentitalea sp. CY04]
MSSLVDRRLIAFNMFGADEYRGCPHYYYGEAGHVIFLADEVVVVPKTIMSERLAWLLWGASAFPSFRRPSKTEIGSSSPV